MIVVSDTSCITNLIAIGRIQLLADLFGTVLIPVAVRGELTVSPARLPTFIWVQAAVDRAAVGRLLDEDLDEGEAEAIVLAEETRASALLIDEAAGRKTAQRLGLRIIGLLGVLRRAKKRGFIPAVRPDLDALQLLGFRGAPALRARVVKDLGET